MSELIYPEESYRIVGACFEVYNEKGSGFLESVYQECLQIEMDMQHIPYVGQKELPLKYKGRPLVQTYKPDFICFDKIIVEIKAVSCLIDEYRAQMLNYLHATGLKLGLLVNFGHYPGLQHERIVL
jgi:GxxExxY protein